ncbi:MAG: ATP-dependent RecD-like DNA helicase [Blautia sp.]|nr:ATP-dependent RecD-like DNA helicase [Blautia sp.]
MEKVTGLIDHVVFRNEENGYTVMVIRLTGGKALTCVGTFPSVSVGLTIEAEGDYTDHPVYGRQFTVRSCIERMPEDQEAVERYLASGAIKGIKAATAAKIVRRFGNDTLRIMEEEPVRLAEIKGISAKKAKEIGEEFAKNSQLRQAMIFLQKYGISPNLSVKICQRYGKDVYQVVQENPYRLADEIQGVGFLTADEIAKRIGIHADSDYRIRCGLRYVLNQAQGEGHIYLPKAVLFARAGKLLGIDSSYLDKHLMDLQLARKVVVRQKEDEERVYDARLFHLELDTARMLLDLKVRLPLDETVFERRLAGLEADTGLVLDCGQRDAVRQACRNGLFILTGGPGTGKTTTINAMLRYFAGERLRLALAAPTGRAAKRMTEATGFEAKTIHRLLELQGLPEEEDDRAEQQIWFARNDENPLETDVLIIDEMSMVDIYLMHSLLKAIPPGTRLILVGDENQLPSVGPGNVLGDIIASHAFPIQRLDRIFRQAEESDIVVNAHKIHRGEEVRLDNKSRDFFFLKRYDPDQVLRVVLSLVKDKLPSYVGAESFDIQVLTPMRKGQMGVERLNVVLQRYLNPPAPDKAEWEIADRVFREGDKVMQTRNNYQVEWVQKGANGVIIEEGVGVFNGDMGIIRKISAELSLVTVEFEEGRFIDYALKQLDELELAYAVTVHKSQGSEYPAVVMPLLSGPAMLLNRNLLYTAVTRAKKCVAIVGDEETFLRMEANVRQQRRCSSLDERVEELL